MKFETMPAADPGPPQRPAADVNGPSAGDLVKAGGSKMAQPSAFNPIGSDAVKAQSQAGQTLDKIGVTTVTAKATPAGDGGNTVSGDPAGGLPPANVISPGTSNRPGVQKTAIGQTKARPRTPINPAYYGKK